ncbi:MAG: OmpA family protein [Candidatus Sumerlaeota bacterium]
MARKPEPEKAENHERWLVSYADFITLLFAFFVVMFATANTEDDTKRKAAGESIQAAFSSFGIFLSGSGSSPILSTGENPGGGPNGGIIMIEGITPGGPGKDNNDAGAGPEEENIWDDFQTPEKNENTAVESEGDPALYQIFTEIQKVLQDELKNSRVVMRQEKRGIVISLGEAGFFDSGSDQLKTASLEIIDNIAIKLRKLLKEEDIAIRIEGHTDNVPLARSINGKIRDNWELSIFRAKSVLDRLKNRHGFPSDSLVFSGYGEHRPIASNDTAEGRARNRRVDIVVLNEYSASREPGR